MTAFATARGFDHLGRFAANYRRCLGETPSATLTHVRAGRYAIDQTQDDARRLIFRAIPTAFAMSPTACTAALEDLEHAQQLAPQDGLAKAVAAWCWAQRAAHYLSRTPDADRNRAKVLACQGSSLAAEDPLTLTIASGALVLGHQLQEATRLLQRAYALDPRSARIWVRRGWLSVYTGHYERAIREFTIALHMDPMDRQRFLALIGIGSAHFGAGRYHNAASWVRDGIEAWPHPIWAERVFVAAATLAGAHEESRRAARRLMYHYPDLTVGQVMTALPYTRSYNERWGEGLVFRLKRTMQAACRAWPIWKQPRRSRRTALGWHCGRRGIV